MNKLAFYEGYMEKEAMTQDEFDAVEDKKGLGNFLPYQMPGRTTGENLKVLGATLAGGAVGSTPAILRHIAGKKSTLGSVLLDAALVGSGMYGGNRAATNSINKPTYEMLTRYKIRKMRKNKEYHQKVRALKEELAAAK